MKTHDMSKMDTYCIVPALFPSQMYDTIGRTFPRRFVLPLDVTNETPTGQNLNTRPSSKATCVKMSKYKVS